MKDNRGNLQFKLKGKNFDFVIKIKKMGARVGI